MFLNILQEERKRTKQNMLLFSWNQKKKMFYTSLLGLSPWIIPIATFRDK